MRGLKIALKITAWSVGVLFGIVLMLYLIALAINWRDQPPSEAALALEAIVRDRPTVADEDNGYVYVMGFDAPADADPTALGVRRIEWLESQPAHATELVGEDPAGKIPSYQRGSTMKALSESCYMPGPECLDAWESVADIEQLLSSEAWLLQRYNRLLEHPGWRELTPLNIVAPLPSYSTVLDGQRLLFMQAWQLAGRGDAAGVRALLAKDLAFWRNTLANSDILISRMIAVAALRHHFGTGNLILRRLPANQALSGMPPAWLEELSSDERSMMRTLAGEYVFIEATLSGDLPAPWPGLGEETELAKKLGHLLSLAFQPMLQQQDTRNMLAENLQHLAITLDVPYEQFPLALEKQQARASGKLFSRVYNLFGDTLFAINGDAYLGYFSRTNDVEGMRRAAVLTTTLRSQGTTIEAAPAAVAASDIRNPYTGKPFEWDARQRALLFFGMEKSKLGRLVYVY